nr:PD-(D/E)XK nuclease family protein [Curvibacter sp. CHRR-16]
MSQLLGRPFAAVVLSGCDAVRLNPSPDVPGGFTRSQRAALGLPSREQLQVQLAQSWQNALLGPVCDVLWRSAEESGESLQASPLVQGLPQWAAYAAHAETDDGLQQRWLQPTPVASPQPSGQALLQRAEWSLSASAYDDLRTCPYRYFAQRQLGLQELEELDGEVGKRDYGQWLHAVLQRFHDGLRDGLQGGLGDAAPHAPKVYSAADRDHLCALLDAACEAELQGQQWSAAEFLPYRAGWPLLREAYLDWWLPHQQDHVYLQGELDQRRQLQVDVPAPASASTLSVHLIGRLDRVDQDSRGGYLLLDYKTEAPQKTRDRVKDPLEDTQLPFYAALHTPATVHPSDTPPRAGYLNLNEREGVKLHEQPALQAAYQALLAGIASDLGRIAAGHPMPALGEGSACEVCRVRGLCRKDFWSPA